MCIAVPGRVLSVKGNSAEVDFKGIRERLRSEFVSVKRGDYVLVFGGNILEVIDKERAEEVLKLIKV